MKRALTFLENRDFYKEGSFQVMTEEHLFMNEVCCDSGCRHCPFKGHPKYKSPRVISLVPSWTETLMAAGVNVVACTRFCAHPKTLTKNTLKVGGTKTVNIEKLNSIDADFIVMDKEENTKETAQACKATVLSSHVCSLEDLKDELLKFSELLNNKELRSYHDRLSYILNLSKEKPAHLNKILEAFDFWTKPPKEIRDLRLAYMIWKTPWMSIQPQTYIGSVLKTLGFKNLTEFDSPSSYPQIDLQQLSPETLVLFSSEPYPFHKEKETLLKSMPFQNMALVDGEAFSWFGLRSLRFLENCFLED